MNEYDPVEKLSEHIRILAEIWAGMGLDWHPAYAAALGEVDRAAQWMDDPETVDAV